MKKILLFLFILTLGYGQTRTHSWALPQWTLGDTLRAGAKNTPATSNFSLNNAITRIDTIASVHIDSSGLLRFVNGRGSGNLTIDAGTATATPQRIVLNDSLYGTYNWQTTANALIGGNVFAGGYITTDSIIISGGTLFLNGGDITGIDDITATYGDFNDSIEVGQSNSVNGAIRFKNDGGNGITRILTLSRGTTSLSDLFLPTITTNETLATIGGGQTFNNVANLTSTGTIQAEQLTADSVKAPNISYLLYSQILANAGTANNDTSNYATPIWIQDTTRTANLEYRRKAKFLYVHKSGNKYITAYFQGKVTAIDVQSGKCQIFIKTMAEATSTSVTSAAITNTSYAAKTLAIDVSGLTTNTPYYVEFRMLNLETASNPTLSVKDAVFYAESQ